MTRSLMIALAVSLTFACNKPASTPIQAADSANAQLEDPPPVFAEPPPSDPPPNDPPPPSDPGEPEDVLPLAAGAPGLTWVTTCGDPACSGYSGPWPGVPACGENEKGAPCSPEGATCDFRSNCNARLLCATKDPRTGPGGCPRSRARFKRDIEYLDAEALAAYHRELLDLSLATFRYRDSDDERVRLGVILEDGEQRERAVWADSAHDRVDLYAYASLAIASAQVQAREIERLEAELAQLRRELDELRGGPPAPRSIPGPGHDEAPLPAVHPLE